MSAGFGLQGKYEQPALAVSVTGRGLAWLHGYIGAESTQTAWFDRTSTERGRRWVAGSAVPADGTNPQSANTVRFLGASFVVSFGGTDGLWVSRDAGATWRQELPGWYVESLAATGQRWWLVASHCLTGSCPVELLSGAPSGTRFTRMPRQPSGVGRLLSVFGLNRGTLVVVGLTRGGALRLATSVDDASTWQRDRLPCPAPAGQPQISSAGGVLWLACLTRDIGPALGEGPHVTYRSLDAGRSWQAMTGGGQPPLSLTVLPIDRSVAWGEAISRGPQGLLRTTDGGAHWTSVPVPWPAATAYIALAPLTADKAWCLAQIAADNGWHFTVYATVDAGRHWTSAELPAARNLPRPATSP